MGRGCWSHAQGAAKKGRLVGTTKRRGIAIDELLATTTPGHSLRRAIFPSRTSLKMSALFHFSSLLLVVLLFICTCTYIRATAPGIVDRNKNGALGLCFKAARIGERLSPYVSLACIVMAAYTIM